MTTMHQVCSDEVIDAKFIEVLRAIDDIHAIKHDVYLTEHQKLFTIAYNLTGALIKHFANSLVNTENPIPHYHPVGQVIRLDE